MPLNTKFVQLDINNPDFQKSWVELEAEDAERVRGALKKNLKLTAEQVRKSYRLQGWGFFEGIAGQP